MPLRPAPLIVLSALLKGLKVTLDDVEYELSENNIVMSPCHDPDYFIADGMTLTQFLNACKRLDDKELFALAANTALNDVKDTWANAREPRKGGD